ncbi:MAG: ATP-grasp domain-containing protein [Nitriliruptoraceae bacterium]|nr:ATP-grasp domain-containing protein [Nitriliruptoraceae bacterium]
MIERIAIVNRGEPAMRLIHAVRELRERTGRPLTTIALHTEAERTAMFVREADEAHRIGPGPGEPAWTTSPYLDHDELIRALGASDADAAWVGWGFVAEHADFTDRCRDAGVTFIGPSGDVMRALGDKIGAKLLAEQAGVPVAPWSGGAVDDLDAARDHADRIGYPLMIKASAGGGGRGIRKVTDPDGLAHGFERARAEGASSFGDPTVFLERVVERARHIEVQIIADGQGGVWAAGVRDCSLQRRNQKVIEESASTALRTEQVEQLKASAAELARLAGYQGAGTVEFLYQPDEELFAFLEVNTRLQVEHPVTELTTGLDLVALQIHVADGGRLEGDPPPTEGHAIEVRLNAEDPERGFSPASGRIEMLTLPVGPGVRVDTGVAEGDRIPPEYDSMIAKIMAFGRDREHAIARLRRALAQTTVLIEGGTTNRAFLLDLLRRDEVIAGDIHTGWLDGLTAEGGWRYETRTDVALITTAIDAYDVEAGVERDRFYASAVRGGGGGAPPPPPTERREIDLRAGGTAYRLQVACTGPDRYLVEHDDTRILVEVERLRRFERRLTIAGQRYRVVAIRQGADQLVEVDGIPHRVSQDDAGMVRSPGPSVVVSITVAPGDEVEQGASLAVLESMKMETVLAAPFTGRVVEVMAGGNTQLDAGAPVVRLEPIADEEETVGDAVSFAALERTGGPMTGDAPAAIDALRRFVLGYDVPSNVVSSLLEVLGSDGDRDDATLVRTELDVLGVFADIASLSRNRRLGDDDDRAEAHAAREYLHAFLRSLDADAEGLPESFRTKLLQALGHYGVTDLARSPELEDSLFRIHLAQQRTSEHVPAILALLERRLAAGAPTDADLAEALRITLDRLIAATQVREPVVGDLARRTRYRCFDQPRLDEARSAVYAEVAGHLEALAADPTRADRDERMAALVAAPAPLLGLLETPIGGAAGVAPMLELLTRRYYRTRELRALSTADIDGRPAVTADFTDPRGSGRVIAVAATAEDLTDALADAGQLALDLDPAAGAGAVADVYLTWGDAPTALDALAAGLEQDLDTVDLPAQLRRVTLSVTVDPGAERPSVEHLTFRRDEHGRFVERRHLRGIHPLVAGRLDLWRFEAFEMTRLPSTDGVYLFEATAHDHPEDTRLFVMSEVRDLTPVFDEAGRVAALPELQHVLAACLDDLRRARAARPSDQRPDWNRVQLNVWPLVELPLDQMDAVIRNLAPTTDGLGLEQVVVHATLAVGDAAPTPVVVRMSRPPGQGLTVRVTEPATEPLKPFDDTTRKVLRARRRGTVYPYELIPLISRSGSPLTEEPSGDGDQDGRSPGFVEYDLDETGELVPVDRPYGNNRAGIVVGVVTTPTERYPEGMTRVALLGDPTKGLGSIAEAESRRVIAGLDLAAELDVPVEWFAVSSGARIAMDSGTENMDWVGRVLRRIIEFTQDGREINIVVAGINVGAQPYWNAEATMLMHTKGVLIMTPDSAMVLTGKQALDYSGGVSAEDNFGIGGYDRVMGPNGQAQHWAPDLASACDVLFEHYEHSYVAPGERFPRTALTDDPRDRDVRSFPHEVEGLDFTRVGDIFSETVNPGRKKPFDIRTLLRAVADQDHAPLERWPDMAGAEMSVVLDAHLGGHPVTLLGIESRPMARRGPIPADGPDQWTAGTLFPRASKKTARAINAASGIRPVVVLANLSGFDGSPESLRELQLEYGAEIGRAVVNFDGPVVFCVVSRYHGGAFVVFSGTLNDTMEIAAVEGSHASVIGGPPAAAVVFAGEVNRRTDADPDLVALRDRMADTDAGDQGRLRAEYAERRAQVRSAKLGEVAAEFDAIHSIQRAKEVGSVDRIVAAAELRPYLIDAVERGMARHLAGPAAERAGTVED